MSEAVEHMEIFVITTFERITDTSFDTGVGFAIAFGEFIIKIHDLTANDIGLVEQNTNAGADVLVAFAVYVEAEAVQKCCDFFRLGIQRINLSTSVLTDNRIGGQAVNERSIVLVGHTLDEIGEVQLVVKHVELSPL